MLRQFIKHTSEIINTPRYFQLPQTNNIFNYSVKFIKYIWKEVAAEKRKQLTLRHYTAQEDCIFANYFPELAPRDK